MIRSEDFWALEQRVERVVLPIITITLDDTIDRWVVIALNCRGVYRHSLEARREWSQGKYSLSTASIARAALSAFGAGVLLTDHPMRWHFFNVKQMLTSLLMFYQGQRREAYRTLLYSGTKLWSLRRPCSETRLLHVGVKVGLNLDSAWRYHSAGYELETLVHLLVAGVHVRRASAHVPAVWTKAKHSFGA